MKYIVAFLLLFALTTELHLKTKLQCKKSGENCFMDFECCDDLICDEGTKTCEPELPKLPNLPTKSKKLPKRPTLGEACKSRYECEEPYICLMRVCKPANLFSGHKCKKNYECESGNCIYIEEERCGRCE